MCATVTNKCGSTEQCLEVFVRDCDKNGGGRRFESLPNPTNGNIRITLPERTFEKGSKKTIKVTDRYSIVQKEIEITGNSIELDLSNLEIGVYYVSIIDQYGITTQQIVKI